MTAVSLINPYAPQPVPGTGPDTTFTAVQNTAPLRSMSQSADMGSSSDQSGAGAGNGTGTGGAQLTALLRRGRGSPPVQQPSPKSIIEAQSEADPATEFLKRQARQHIEAKAAEEARAAARAEAKATEARAEALKAAQPEYVMPTPLPTAPILERDDA